MSSIYDEVRILFDRYIEDSLKAKTRAQRATSTAAARASYDVHDQMSISTVSLRELLSSSKTKKGLCKLLSEALLVEFEASSTKIVVSYSNLTKVKPPYTIEEDLKIHGHEEADTLIPLHVLDCLRESTFRDIHVRSPDTDVFILLMDLVSNNRLGTLSELKFCTGTSSKYREIDVKSRVQVIGEQISRALIGLHNFTGADWGGKFVGISKKTWVDAYMSLEDNSPITQCFCNLGEGALSPSKLLNFHQK